LVKPAWHAEETVTMMQRPVVYPTAADNPIGAKTG